MDHLAGIAQLANELSHITRIVIEPYHTLGVGKYERLGKRYSLLEIPSLDRSSATAVPLRSRNLTFVSQK